MNSKNLSTYSPPVPPNFYSMPSISPPVEENVNNSGKNPYEALSSGIPI